MEHVDLKKIIRDPENYFSHYFLGVCDTKKLAELRKQNKFDLENVKIEISVDGINVHFDKFEKFLKYCAKSYASDWQEKIDNLGAHIEKKAKALLEEKTSGLFEKVNDLENAISCIEPDINSILGWEYFEKEE